MPRRKRRIWTPAELAIVRARYADVPTLEIAKQLRRPIGQVYQCAARLRLKKSAAYLASPAAHRIQREQALQNPRLIANQFKKGHVPANKGLRRPGYAAGRMAETQFKKGRAPHEARNYKPIGTLRVNTKDHYLERKVTDDPSLVPARRWVGVHRLVWEAAHGPIPPGHRVAFKGGRKTNVEAEITLDRLELVTPAEMMRRNTVHNLPKPIAQVAQLIGAINRQINKRQPPVRPGRGRPRKHRNAA